MQHLAALTDIIARHTPGDGGHAGPLPGVTLWRAAAPTMPMPVVYGPTICLIIQGRKRVVLGSTAFLYDPSMYLMASVDLPVMGTVIEASPQRPYLCLQLDLDMAMLGELILGDAAGPAEAPAMGMWLGQTTPALLDAAMRLAGLLDTPRDIATLAPLTIREILYRLLIGPSGPILRQMAQANSRLSQIARAILWIRAHFRESCPVEGAAEVAGMSRSTFHAHFRAVTAMSPLEFRTQLRMQEAQRLMVSEALDAANAGFQVGYGSPSQFSRDYARLFGMPPARHAGQLRGNLAMA